MGSEHGEREDHHRLVAQKALPYSYNSAGLAKSYISVCVCVHLWGGVRAVVVGSCSDCRGGDVPSSAETYWQGHVV